MNQDRFYSVVGDYFEGDLALSAQEELSAALRDDAELRREFVRESYLHRQLYDAFRAGAGDARLAGSRRSADARSTETAAQAEAARSKGVNDPASAQRASSRPLLGFLTESVGGVLHGAPTFSSLSISIGVLLASLGWIGVGLWITWWRGSHLDADAPRQNIVASAGVAQLTGVVDCRWEGTRRPVKSDVLQAGEFQLVSGTAEITLSNGVTLLVEGPTQIDLESPQRTYLHSGRLSAKVSAGAVGYTVATPSATIVDLGTEFGVETNTAGDTEVHVFTGRVALQPHPSPDTQSPDVPSTDGESPAPILLVASQSKRVEIVGPEHQAVVRDVVTAVRAFPRELPLSGQADLRQPEYPPTLVAFWNFDEDHGPAWDQVSRNHGGLVEVERVPGLVGHGAVRFDNMPGQMVRIPGRPTGDLQFTTGLTVEALFVSHWSGARLDYDEFFRKEDSVGTLTLSFQNDDGDSVDGPVLGFEITLNAAGTATLELPLDGREGRPSLAELTDGRPHHVASTFESASGEMALYIDGRKRISRQLAKGSLLHNVVNQPASIGNYPVDPREPFSGVLDEVALYNTALTADEIAAHWKNAAGGRGYYPLSPQPSSARARR